MKKKIAVTVIFCVAVFIFVLYRYYNLVQDEHWAEQNKAKQIAIREAGITEVTRVDPYIWDEAYYVVTGKDVDGHNKIVWISEDGKKVDSLLATDGVSKQQVKDIMKQRVPKAQILRILPGKMKDAEVWEVFYTLGERHYYDFYQFKDGGYVVTYQLSQY
jgi:uncharacterized protein YpmB